MFNLDKKFASVKLVADVIKTLGSSFDVISKAVLQNKKDIRDLQARIKDSKPFLHYYDLDKKGYRYATNWEIL